MSKDICGKSLDVEAVFAPESLGKEPKGGTHTTVGVDSKGRYWGQHCKGCQALLNTLLLGGRAQDYGEGLKSPLASIYSSLWRRDDQTVEEALEYWRYCLSDEYSPWRIAAKDSEIIYKDGIPIAYKLVNMSAPCQVIANLCFAMRMPYAQDGYLRMFTALKKEGFTNTESLFIAANVRLGPTQILRYPYVGDYPFDTSWRDISWKRWSTGKPIFKADNIPNTSHACYHPCNAIWTDGHQTGDNYTYGGRQPTTIQKLLTVNKFEYKGAFQSTWGSIDAKDVSKLPVKETVSFAKAVEILKATKDQWKVG